jgi:hypothetical protein
MTEAQKDLINHLALSGGLTSETERLLFLAWGGFKFPNGDGGMEAYKLLNRTEDLAWNAPILSFNIERHGATVGGSVYAEVQSWQVNTESGEAILGEGQRGRYIPGTSRSKRSQWWQKW